MKRFRVKENVTPKMAKEMMGSRRENQRGLNERHVAELADAMSKGRWKENGEPIKYDVDGFLIDGQHRLAACIKSGKSFITDIVYGLPLDAYYTINQKITPRSPSDVLKINGEVSTASLASALLWNMAYNGGSITKRGKGFWLRPDPQEICVELSRNPTMRESVVAGNNCGKGGLMAKAPLCFLHYQFKQKDSVMADKFLHQLKTGEDLTANSPILQIRKVLLADKMQNKAKLPMGEKMAYVIKGWNLMRNGKTAKSVTSIKWGSGGQKPEPFPKIL